MPSVSIQSSQENSKTWSHCNVGPAPHLSERTDVDDLKYLIIHSHYQPAPNYLSLLIWSIYLDNLLLLSVWWILQLKAASFIFIVNIVDQTFNPEIILKHITLYWLWMSKRLKYMMRKMELMSNQHIKFKLLNLNDISRLPDLT